MCDPQGEIKTKPCMTGDLVPEKQESKGLSIAAAYILPSKAIVQLLILTLSPLFDPPTHSFYPI